MRFWLVLLAASLFACAGEIPPDGDGSASASTGASGMSGGSASASTGSSGDSGSSSSSSGSDSGSSTGDSASASSSGSDSGSSMGDSGSSSSASSSSGTGSGSTGISSSTSSSSSGSTGGTTGSPTALLRSSNPMSCADPAVVSEQNAGQTFFVFCTGMSHIWKTTDWIHFSDVRSSTRFDLTGMSANGKHIGSWWAPGVLYAPGLNEYVMWVSVPDVRATDGADGWDTRSLAVLTADSPDGTWTFRGIGLAATAAGQHFIDPFLFRDHDGSHYVFFKQYGGGVSSSIMGAHVKASWLALTSAAQVEIMNGYGGSGTWEDNVRENPAVWYDAATGHHHMIFSGGHWRDDTYATGHAVSSCGVLCKSSGGWHMKDSGDRGVLQVVQAKGDANFTSGGPGGAVFLDDSANDIIYAAAARSASGSTTRYLMRDHLSWQNDSPFVDTGHHRPHGL